MVLLSAYAPDDGTQGHTPYFYKMDVPVRVRSSISYGRAWQLLRSRGAGSNATGPCDPPQNANSCNCSAAVGAPLPHNPGVTDNDDAAAMPRCIASPLCGAVDDAAAVTAWQRSSSSTAAVAVSDRTNRRSMSILLVIDMERTNMRFPIGTCSACLRRGYGKAVREIIRVLLSLREVNTTLPVHVLASSERYPAVEALLTSLFNVSFLSGTAPPVVVPLWASKWARGSFAKLRALTLTQFDRLVVLDYDAVVLRNVDHLASLEAPAFVYGWKCYPRRELRASTMVLQPNLDEWREVCGLIGDPNTAIYDDLGEQAVWRRLYHQRAVHELPAGYAALRTADMPASEWLRVHIVHDAHLIHDVQVMSL